MTYDDWKSTDTSEIPDASTCVECSYEVVPCAKCGGAHCKCQQECVSKDCESCEGEGRIERYIYTVYGQSTDQSIYEGCGDCHGSGKR